MLQAAERAFVGLLLRVAREAPRGNLQRRRRVDGHQPCEIASRELPPRGQDDAAHDLRHDVSPGHVLELVPEDPRKLLGPLRLLHQAASHDDASAWEGEGIHHRQVDDLEPRAGKLGIARESQGPGEGEERTAGAGAPAVAVLQELVNGESQLFLDRQRHAARDARRHRWQQREEERDRSRDGRGIERAAQQQAPGRGRARSGTGGHQDVAQLGVG